ncbi:MAG: acetyl-CoA carboxylase biotin carboxylase subunit [Polyangiales bacterium]
MRPPFDKVLVANRGEIAVRIMRTLREMGIKSIAVYSEVDRAALHVRMADEAYCIGPAPAAQSYLRGEKILDVCRKSGAKAVHPGYGFLSENAGFAKACEDAGVVFIGPPSHAIRDMGSKTGARAIMIKAGVPVVPGGTAANLDEARTEAKRIGYPVMLKAVNGGGGKGMRVVDREEDLGSAWERARSEALKAFGSDDVYLEKAILRPRHVEIQVLGDKHGNVIHLFERDCSIQRRQQKVVEETPCPVATPELVARMGAIAVQGAKHVGYYSAGTFEFLLDRDGSFYFLEMNTRLQVEHPVTELITGVDLVREMILVAAGEKLELTQDQVQRRGAAIECRIYAEDPATDFMPSPGKIVTLKTPSGPGVRDDGGAYPGATISSFYDPLVSKLSVWAPTRALAIARMRRALGEYVVTGIRTNLAFHQKLFEHPEFVAGDFDTGFIPRHRDALMGYAKGDPNDEQLAAAIAIAAAQLEQRAGAATAVEGAQGARLSPWVAASRSALR